MSAGRMESRLMILDTLQNFGYKIAAVYKEGNVVLYHLEKVQVNIVNHNLEKEGVKNQNVKNQQSTEGNKSTNEH